jgi:hypothetical protein
MSRMMMNPHDAPTGDLVRVERVSKTYPGVEAPLRGTKLEWKGPALWARNLTRAVRLTSSAAPSVTALHEVSLSIAPGEIFGGEGESDVGVVMGRSAGDAYGRAVDPRQGTGFGRDRVGESAVAKFDALLRGCAADG